jgi:osmotically-inducible protein OsmY
MKKRTLLFVIFAALAGGASFAQQATETTAPDNTKVNKRDRSKAEPTADQQSNAKADRDLTRKIRQTLVKDKDLSTYAHNIKVITRNGAVTLKGPVRSEEEKKLVEAKAAEVAGGANITSELEVAPQQKTKQ